MILDETRERFIKAIAKQVDPARIAEIHFFSPIRQGGVESGVAVIAAAEPVLTESHPEDVAQSTAAEGPLDVEPVLPESHPEDEAQSAAAEGSLDVEPVLSERHPEDEAQSATAEGPLDAEEESPYLEAMPPQDDVEVAVPIERHVIYTARYRLTLKGVDRGKWETNVTAEADAPIITVDAVVRGVQRRSGDVDDPTRMTGDELRAALPATAPL